MPIGWALLAQQDRAVRNWITVTILCVVLLALVLILGVFVLWLRKKYVEGEQPAATEPLTLGDLRDMHAKGLLSEEEFARLKEQIIQEARSGAGLDEDVESEPASTSDKLRRALRGDRAAAEQPPGAAEPETDSQTEGRENGPAPDR